MYALNELPATDRETFNGYTLIGRDPTNRQPVMQNEYGEFTLSSIERGYWERELDSPFTEQDKARIESILVRAGV